MKKILKSVLPLFFICIVSGFVLLVGEWELDNNYTIHFSGSKVEGTISGLNGKVIFDPKDVKNAFIDLEVNSETIKTGNQIKDEHAKNSDWLDTRNFPKIKFQSKSITQVNDRYEVLGNLELHGVKKLVVIPFQFLNHGDKAEFIGKFIIDRKEFGIKGNIMASMMSGKMEIEFKIPVEPK